MQLTEINMPNKFTVIITADWNDADYITIQRRYRSGCNY